MVAMVPCSRSQQAGYLAQGELALLDAWGSQRLADLSVQTQIALWVGLNQTYHYLVSNEYVVPAGTPPIDAPTASASLAHLASLRPELAAAIRQRNPLALLERSRQCSRRSEQLEFSNLPVPLRPQPGAAWRLVRLAGDHMLAHGAIHPGRPAIAYAALEAIPAVAVATDGPALGVASLLLGADRVGVPPPELNQVWCDDLALLGREVPRMSGDDAGRLAYLLREFSGSCYLSQPMREAMARVAGCLARRLCWPATSVDKPLAPDGSARLSGLHALAGLFRQLSLDVLAAWYNTKHSWLLLEMDPYIEQEVTLLRAFLTDPSTVKEIAIQNAVRIKLAYAMMLSSQRSDWEEARMQLVAGLEGLERMPPSLVRDRLLDARVLQSQLETALASGKRTVPSSQPGDLSEVAYWRSGEWRREVPVRRALHLYLSGQFDNARTLLDPLLASLENVWRRASDDHERGAALRESALLVSLMVDCLARRGAYAKALTWHENGRGRALASVLDAPLRRPTNVSDADWLAILQTKLRLPSAFTAPASLQDTSGRLTSASAAIAAEADAKQIAAKGALNELVAKIEGDNPGWEWHDSRPVAPPAYRALAEALGATLVSFRVLPDRTLILGITADGRPMGADVPGLGLATVQRLVLGGPADQTEPRSWQGWHRWYWHCCADGQPWHEETMKYSAGLDAVLQQLSEKLAEPLIACLPKGGEPLPRLVLAPQAELSVLPLHALPIGGGARLLDAYEISYIPSLEVLRRCHARDQFNPSQKTSLRRALVANELLPGAVVEAALLGSPNLDFEVLHPRSLDDVVNHMFGACWLSVLSHGRLDRHDPLDSALGFGGDVAVSARQLIGKVRLSPGAIVWLGACESGLREPGDPVDEAFGLSYGFLRIGAAAVVAAQWLLDDVAGLLLSHHAHVEMHRGASAPSALRKAQCWLRDSSGADRLAVHDGAMRFLASDPSPRARRAAECLDAIGPAFERPRDGVHDWAALHTVGL